ncbi:MAG: hypothetical protein ABR567_07200 [Myxococcales bacterium]|nr:hypothetical protein [Myxococcales bacterium]
MTTRARRNVVFAVAPSILIALNVGWFHVIRYDVLMGDDVYLYDAFSHGSFVDTCLTGRGGAKYRPVYFTLEWLITHAVGPHYASYVWVNIGFSILLSFVVFLLARWLARGNDLVGLGAGILFVTSRFAWYEVAQVLGLMEALAVLWTLAMVYFAFRFVRAERLRDALGMCAAYFLAAFTHERFLAAAPFLAAAMLWSRTRALRDRVLLAAVVISPLPLYVLLKKALQRPPFFLGTGGTPIAFDLKQTVKFWAAGLINVFGINKGPEYLSIVDYRHLPALNQALGVAIAAAGVTLVALFLGERRRPGALMVAWVGSLIAGLLLTASITFRQEFRWLYAPYVVALLFWSYAAVRTSRPALAGAACAVLAVASVINDAYLRSQRRNLYLFVGEEFAQSFYEQSLKRYGWQNREFYVVPFESSDWYFPPTLFFEQFLGEHAMPVRRFDEGQAASWDISQFDRAKIFASAGTAGVVDVTATMLQRAYMRERRVVADLTDRLATAHIEGQQRSRDLPGGAQVSVVDLGWARGILSLPPAAVGFDLGILRQSSPWLAVSVAFHPASAGWNVSDGVQAGVRLLPEHGKEQQLWFGEVNPGDPARFLALPLSSCDGQDCHLILETRNAPAKHTLGDWLVWFDPVIVTDR